MESFVKVVLYTGRGGRAKFREENVPLSEGTPQAMLSSLFPSSGFQLRRSPVGFRSPFHCTVTPQWVFILDGLMEIGLRDGMTRIFHPGEHFYSADTVPQRASFDPHLHGHWSAQHGDAALVTLFVKS